MHTQNVHGNTLFHLAAVACPAARRCCSYNTLMQALNCRLPFTSFDLLRPSVAKSQMLLSLTQFHIHLHPTNWSVCVTAAAFHKPLLCQHNTPCNSIPPSKRRIHIDMLSQRHLDMQSLWHPSCMLVGFGDVDFQPRSASSVHAGPVALGFCCAANTNYHRPSV